MEAFERCRFVSSLGPECCDEDSLSRLLDAGVDACYLNYSHERHEVHSATLHSLRAAEAARGRGQVAVIMDVKGSEVRTGFFRERPYVDLRAGHLFDLVTDTSRSFRGDSTCVAVDSADLTSAAKTGDVLVVAQGALLLRVLTCRAGHVTTRIMNSCRLGESQSCVLPGMQQAGHCVPEDILRDLLTFGIPNGIDYVALGCVRGADEVRRVRQMLGERGRHMGILAKLGCEAGVNNFEEILRVSDGIVISRGDLAARLTVAKALAAEKSIISRCNRIGKPVIVPTMLQEMTCGSKDVSDAVASALDGADAVIFSSQSLLSCAHSKAGLAALQRVREVVKRGADWSPGGAEVPVVLASREKLTNTAGKLRRNGPVLALTTCGNAARKLQVLRGVWAEALEDLPTNAQAAVDAVAKAARRRGVPCPGAPAAVLYEQAEEEEEKEEVEGQDQEEEEVEESEEEQEEGAAEECEAEQLVPSRCKIMCTFGRAALPASQDVDALLEAGVDAIRLPADCAEDKADAIVQLQRCSGQRTTSTIFDVDLSGLLSGDIAQHLRDADYLCVGGVRNASGLKKVREALQDAGVRLLVRIMTEESYRNVEDIIQHSDGILVAQDELAQHMAPEEAFLAQRVIIRKCNAACKPVVVIASPNCFASVPGPSPYSLSVLSSAILEGADCVALPDGAATKANVQALHELVKHAKTLAPPCRATLNPVLDKAAQLLNSSGAGLLAVESHSMQRVAEVATLRPAVPILAVARQERLARQMSVLRGVVPMHVRAADAPRALEVANLVAILEARRTKLLSKSEPAVLLRGKAVTVVEPDMDSDDEEEEDVCCAHGVKKLQEAQGSLPAFSIPKLNLSSLSAPERWNFPSLGLTEQQLRSVRQQVEGVASAASNIATRTAMVVSEKIGEASVAAAEQLSQAAQTLEEQAPGGLMPTARSWLGQLQAFGERLLPDTYTKPVNNEFSTQFLAQNKQRSGVTTLGSGLQYKVLQQGHGSCHPSASAACLCHYEGCVAQNWPAGQRFVSTRQQGEPQELLVSEVIPGWAEALREMVEGDKWEVFIPSELGYGDRGSPPDVQGGDVLVFEVELLEIRGETVPVSTDAEVAPPVEEAIVAQPDPLFRPLFCGEAGDVQDHQVTIASNKQELTVAFAGSKREAIRRFSEPVKEMARKIDGVCKETAPKPLTNKHA